MSNRSNPTTSGRNGGTGKASRLAEIWADIKLGQRRQVELNRPWLEKAPRSTRSR